MPGIDKAEFGRRIENIQAEMERMKLDALMVYGDEYRKESLRYVSDFWPIFERGACFIPRQGEPILVINRGKCHYTIADLLEVIFDASGKKEKQITDMEDPKHLLSHASSGLGYMMAICRPVSQLAALLRKREKGRRKRTDLHKGTKLGRL